jgi:hypothetical protein
MDLSVSMASTQKILKYKNRSKRQKFYYQKKLENWPCEHENVHINKVKVSGLMMNDYISIARFASSPLKT